MAELKPFSPDELEEFNRAWTNFFQGKNDAYIQDLFRLFDRDGNGKISRKELKITMNSCIGLISDEEIDGMLNEADTNSDGYIQQEELLQILKKQRDK